MKTEIRNGLKLLLDWALVIVLLPQVFLLCYYFPYLTHKSGWSFKFVAEIAKYGLDISWVSAPVLTVLFMIYRSSFRRTTNGFLIWAGCFVFGLLWIAGWNLLVYPSFNLWKASVPLLIISSVTCIYTVSCRIYRTGAMARSEEEQRLDRGLPAEETPEEAGEASNP